MSAIPNLVDLLNGRYVPIQESILSALDIGSIIALGKTCRQFNHLQVLKFRLYNIHDMLSMYFTDPLEFRNLQAKFNIILNGPAVISFLYGEQGVPRTLNLHVNNWFPEVDEYLEEEGYIPLYGEPRRTHVEIWTKGSLTLNEWREWNGSISSAINPPNSLSSYNFVSWNKSFSLFPYHTFIQKGASLEQILKDDERTYPADSSISDIKAAIIEQQKAEAGIGKYRGIKRQRRIGDSRTWIMDLDTKGVTTRKTPDDVIECITFIPQALDFDRPVPWWYIDINPLRYPVLAHDLYTHERQHASPSYNSKIDALAQLLDDLSKMELRKLSDAEIAADEYVGDYLAGDWEADLLMMELDEYPHEKWPTWTYHDTVAFRRLREIAEEEVAEFDRKIAEHWKKARMNEEHSCEEKESSEEEESNEEEDSNKKGDSNDEEDSNEEEDSNDEGSTTKRRRVAKTGE